jgi:hypothetical protein
MFTSGAEQVQVAPDVAVHPYAAWSWLVGDAPYSDVWGPKVQDRDQRGPHRYAGWRNIDELLWRALAFHERLANGKTEENRQAATDLYTRALTTLAFFIDDFGDPDQLPAMPSWLVDDLYKAEADGLIAARDGSDGFIHPHSDAGGMIRVRLPRNIPTYEEEEGRPT